MSSQLSTISTTEETEIDRLPFEFYLEMLDHCESDTEFLAAFAVLPKALQSKEISTEIANQLVDRLPIDFIVRMLNNREEDISSDYQTLALEILSLLIPRCDARVVARLGSIEDAVLALIDQPITSMHIDNMVIVYFHLAETLKMSTGNICKMLDVFCASVKSREKAEISSWIVIFDCLQNGLCTLNSRSPNSIETRQLGFWPTDLRIIVRRILQSKPIDDTLRRSAFHVSYLALELLDWRWLADDPEFLVLLTALNDVQLRLLLDCEMKQVDAGQLVISCRIAETVMGFVESDELDLNDRHATQLSRTSQETVSFLCEYVVACNVEKIAFRPEIVISIYRCICSFLAIGGWQIIDATILKKVAPILVEIAEQSLAREEADIASLIMPSLANLPNLPDTVLRLLMGYLRKKYPTSECEQSLEMVTSILQDLSSQASTLSTSKRNWMKPDDLTIFFDLARRIGNVQLIEVLSSL